MTTDIWKARQEPDKFSPHEMSTGADRRHGQDSTWYKSTEEAENIQ